MEDSVQPITKDRPSRLLLAPLFFAFGIIFYFSLTNEPTLWAAMVVWVFISLVLLLMRGQKFFFLALSLWWVVAGFTLANSHGYYRAGGNPDSAWVAGTVSANFVVAEWVDVVSSQKEKRALIAKVEKIDGVAVSPFLLRVTDPKKLLTDGIDNLPRGRWLMKLRLFPLPIKNSLGGYDLGRDWWFRGYKAAAVFLAAPILLTDNPTVDSKTTSDEVPTDSHAVISVDDVQAQRLKQKIKNNILGDYPPDVAGMVLAMITGARDEIPSYQMRQYTESGLVHLISISGVHMGLIAGLSFYLLRFLLLVVRPRGDGYLYKKIAAAMALLMTTGYFMLASYSSASLRATLMTGVAFVGIMLGRRAVSLENLALSMLLVLCYQPVDIFNPGFQLSFAAMLVLVGLYERWWGVLVAEIEQGIFFRPVASVNEMAIFMGKPEPLVRRSWWLRIRIFFFAITLSGFFITLFGLPITLFHFHQASFFGVVANTLAIPLMDIIGLPLLFFKVLLMPLQPWLGQVWPLDWLITAIFRLLNLIAIYVRGDSQFLLRGGSFPVFALFLYSIGFYLMVVLTQWRGRVMSLLLLSLSLVMMLCWPRPVFMANQTGTRWLAHMDSGWVGQGGDSFLRRQWQEENNIDVIGRDLPAPSFCDANLCRLVFGDAAPFIITIAKPIATTGPKDWRVVCQGSSLLLSQDILTADMRASCQDGAGSDITIIDGAARLAAVVVHPPLLSGLWPSLSSSLSLRWFGYRVETLPIGQRPWRYGSWSAEDIAADGGAP